MKLVAPFLSILALSLAAAFNAAACNRYVKLSDFDTSCQQDSDCIPVYIGPPVCCAYPNAAINASDQAKYESEISGEDEHNGCDVGCFKGAPEVTFCNAGTCAIAPVESDGTDGGTLDCGGFTCSDGEVCVSELMSAGTTGLFGDAGGCPAGEQNMGGICQSVPMFHCAAAPPACDAGLSCACAGSVCDIGFNCQSASAGVVQCVAVGP